MSHVLLECCGWYDMVTVDYVTPSFILHSSVEVHMLRNHNLHEILRVSSFSDLIKGIAELLYLWHSETLECDAVLGSAHANIDQGR